MWTLFEDLNKRFKGLNKLGLAPLASIGKLSNGNSSSITSLLSRSETALNCRPHVNVSFSKHIKPAIRREVADTR